MRLVVAAALAAVVAGCAGDPMRRVAAPAPAGALECARRALAELGYVVQEGSVDRGSLYLQRPTDGLVADVIVAEEGAGELRLFAAARTSRNRYAPPSQESLGHVQAVISRCAG